MTSPDPSDDSYDPEEPWDLYDDDVPSQQPTQVNKLGLCQFADWDSGRTYDEVPPVYIHYSIEWKVTVNNRAIMPKDTEQDVVLAPAAYWKNFLQPKLQTLLQKKNRPLTSEYTTVVVSVMKAREHDLTKRFDETDIDWSVIEKQLIEWGGLFRAGKKLLLNLSFNYVDASQSRGISSRGVNTRSRLSTTQRMLDQREAQLAEQGSAGKLPIWQKVYNFFRCRNAHCDKGPHCWIDPVGKKHYKLRSPRLQDIITHVQGGGPLETHDDVPQDIRDQLYLEVQQSLERHKKASNNTSATSGPNINITNMLPSQSPLQGNSRAGTPVPDMPQINRLDIPGFRDEIVEEYCAWQQSRVKRQNLKNDFKTACDTIIERNLDLETIQSDPDLLEVLDKKGVQKGTVLRILCDIDHWVGSKKRKRTEIEEV